MFFCVSDLLSDPSRFLESLFKFDKDNISDSVISKIQPYIDNPVFTPANIEKVSKACTSLCLWVRCVLKYGSFIFTFYVSASYRRSERLLLVSCFSKR